jgi:hypothetical protein
MLNIAHYKRMCRPQGACLFFGGDSSSSQSAENTDMRVVGGDGSINMSQKVSGSNNVVTTTDHGAVKGGIDLALKGIEAAHDTTTQVIASQGSLLDGALRMVSDQAQQNSKQLADIKGNDVHILVIVGLGVVGLAAVFALKKG